ncbi:boophilin-H2-like protein [Leptotrombidium deliense]|uniref:Boophilin-H2-like protein n=1 Tax=Leptotrombidium deliense TaxID=299467 RepID=A0A443S6E3_9ACAR|nr:boophilin-H2-like protein [Leptotrombidium deliense]
MESQMEIFNNILDLLKCVLFSKDSGIETKNNDECLDESKVVGKCKAMFLMYSYDNNSNVCEQFFYGGCGGTRNRFKTQVECVQKCVQKL